MKIKVEFKTIDDVKTEILANGEVVGEIVKERKCINRRLMTFKKIYFKGQYVGMHSTQADTRWWIKDALSREAK